MFDLYLAIIALLALISWVIYFRATRGMQYLSNDCDNEKQVEVARDIGLWKWPSDMHKSSAGKTKTFTKDVVIFLLAIWQKILRDKETDHPLVTLSALAHAGSSIIVYIIGTHFWDPLVAFFVAVIFLVSAWNWLIALLGGHMNIATTVFLLTVLGVLQISSFAGTAQFVWLILVGVLFGLTMFSSASSRKFIVLFFVALFYVRYQEIIASQSLSALWDAMLLNHSVLVNVYVPVLALAFILIMFLFYRPLVRRMHAGRAGALNRMIESGDKHSVDHYLAHGRKQVGKVSAKLVQVIVFLLFIINAIGLPFLLPYAAGFFAVIFLFTLPNVKTNLTQYFKYYYLSKTSKNRFVLYTIWFDKAGRKIPFAPDENGIKRSSWDWIVKYFWRMVPLQSLLYVASAVYLLYLGFVAAPPYDALVLAAVLILFSLSPALWGELTKGPQVGRTYAPQFLGMTLLIGVAASLLPETREILIAGAAYLAAITLLDVYRMVKWIFPERMGVRSLVRALEERGINEIYTYDCVFNNAFINCMDAKVRDGLHINYVQSIADVPRGAHMVIPPTSSKSYSMESEMEAVMNGDFRSDPVLNDLLESKRIADVALERFQTFASSRFWVHESELPSYRELIIHNTDDDDRFRGLGWIVQMPV